MGEEKGGRRSWDTDLYRLVRVHILKILYTMLRSSDFIWSWMGIYWRLSDQWHNPIIILGRLVFLLCAAYILESNIEDELEGLYRDPQEMN